MLAVRRVHVICHACDIYITQHYTIWQPKTHVVRQTKITCKVGLNKYAWTQSQAGNRIARTCVEELPLLRHFAVMGITRIPLQQSSSLGVATDTQGGPDGGSFCKVGGGARASGG
jgi:hypothetical protein